MCFLCLEHAPPPWPCGKHLFVYKYSDTISSRSLSRPPACPVGLVTPPLGSHLSLYHLLQQDIWRVLTCWLFLHENTNSVSDSPPSSEPDKEPCAGVTVVGRVATSPLHPPFQTHFLGSLFLPCVYIVRAHKGGLGSLVFLGATLRFLIIIIAIICKCPMGGEQSPSWS